MKPTDHRVGRASDLRRLAVAVIGFCTFLSLYSPQALLPSLAKEFGVGAATISTLITASTLAVALTAPFTGAIADVVGRKRLITAAMFAAALPMVMVAQASDVSSIIVWRFVQGALLPPIFTVALAYIGDEWPASEVAGIAGIYVSGSSLGGFCGRFVPGLLADIFGWRPAFLVLAGMGLAGALFVAFALPHETRFVRSDGLASSLRQMLRHLRNKQLVATYAIGFGVLFNFVAVFTYVSFHLAAPPYDFSSTWLGAIFVTYLFGTLCTPLTGRAVMLFGRRGFLLGVLAAWLIGLALLLSPPLFAIVLGLSLCAGCGLLCQAISTGYVVASAREGRSSAVGLYVSAFYIGGSVGGFLPGLAWSYGGWPAVVALAAVMVAVMATIVVSQWQRT